VTASLARCFRRDRPRGRSAGALPRVEGVAGRDGERDAWPAVPGARDECARRTADAASSEFDGEREVGRGRVVLPAVAREDEVGDAALAVDCRRRRGVVDERRLDVERPQRHPPGVEFDDVALSDSAAAAERAPGESDGAAAGERGEQRSASHGHRCLVRRYVSSATSRA